MRTISKVALGTAVAGLALLAYAQRPGEGTRQDQERVERNERLYHFHNVVRGRVTDDSGRPVAGVRVFARFRLHQSGGVGEGGTTTRADGTYELRALGVNDFMAGVEVRGTPYLVPDPQGANLRHDTLLVRDFVLHVGPLVTVRVLDAETGAPVVGLDVHRNEFGAGGPLLGQTDAKGEVSWHLNALKEAVVLGNPVETASREAVGAAPGYRFDHEFRVGDGQPVWATKSYDKPFALKNVTFRGVVTDEGGAPLAGARVHFRQDNEERDASVGRDGRFAFLGRRIVDFADNHQDDIVLFADKDARTSTVRPTPEETWGEMRIVAREGNLSEVHGRVVDENGRPAAGLPIVAYQFFVGGSLNGDRGEVVGPDGAFSLPKLRPGSSLRFAFGGGPWGVVEVPPLHPWTKPFAPVAGGRIDLGTLVIPHADASLALTIRREDGEIERRPTMVVLEGAHTKLSLRLDGMGKAAFPNVVAEPLTLRVYSCEKDYCTYGPGGKNELLVRSMTVGERHLDLTVKWRSPYWVR